MRRLLWKVLAVFAVLAVVPLAVVGIAMVWLNETDLQSAILEKHTRLVMALAEKIDGQIGRTEERLQFISQIARRAPARTFEEKDGLLRSILAASEEFVRVALVNRKGEEELLSYNPELEPDQKRFDRSADPTFREAMETGRPRRSGIYYASVRYQVPGPGGAPAEVALDDPRMDIVVPLGRPDRPSREALFVVATFRRIWSEVEQTRVDKHGFLYLVDAEGRILAHPDRKQALERRDARDRRVVAEAIASASLGSTEFSDPAGGPIVAAYAPIPRLGWRVILEQPKGEAYLSSEKLKRAALWGLFGAVLLVFLLSGLAARRIARPVLRLRAAAREFMVHKRLSRPVEIRSRDELGDLASAFNEMAGDLETYIHSIFQGSADYGIALVSDDGILQKVNEAACGLLRLRLREGEKLWNTAMPEEMRKALTSLLSSPQERTTEEVSLPPEDAEQAVRWLRIRSQKVGGGRLLFIRDVTEEKALEEMKDRFVHQITHDLRNPLTSIQGFQKLLVEGVGGPITEQQRRFLEIMGDSSQRLLSLINQILDVAKLEAGRMELSLQEFDLSSLARRVCDSFSGRAMEQKIRLTCEAPAASVRICADAELLERVLANLVSNALKYTPENGEVRVRVEPDPNGVTVSVSDTGEGIPPEAVGKIFGKFQQLRLTDRRKGTGLGLNFCKLVVEQHKGRIWVTSELGRGSTFSFYLPRGLLRNAHGEIAVQATPA